MAFCRPNVGSLGTGDGLLYVLPVGLQLVFVTLRHTLSNIIQVC